MRREFQFEEVEEMPEDHTQRKKNKKNSESEAYESFIRCETIPVDPSCRIFFLFYCLRNLSASLQK